jgi:hypothetical protein
MLELSLQVVHHLVGSIRLDLLVVVSGIVVSSIGGPVLLDDLLDTKQLALSSLADVSVSDDAQPGKDSPD